MNKKKSLATALLTVMLLLPTLALGSEGGAEVGKAPPFFKLADETGEVHGLNDYTGRPTILYFTHNMCHYCTQIIAFLKRAHATYADDGLAIVTINVWADGAKLIRRYKEQFGLPFSMLAGKSRQLLRDYEVNYVPIVVFVGRDGLIRRVFHHYVLEQDFKASVREIVSEATGLGGASDAPSSAPSSAVSSAKEVPSSKAIPNATEATAGNAENGKDIYGRLCANCHGTTGKGDGKAAQYAQPADHTDREYMSTLSDPMIFDMVKKGGAAVGKSSVMMPFDVYLSDEEITDVVAFVRTLSD